MTPELDRLRNALKDRYAVEREIGRGGMATVYLAQDLKHRRPVAIKVLSEEVAHAIGAERFLREIHVAARLNNPHIVPLHDSGNADGLLYYVMAYMEGENLRDRLKRERQLSFADVLSITNDISLALAHAHSQGVLHRDIKPENIMLSSGSAVVADFGIARALTYAGTERLTGSGISLGTPDYMSPEQALGEPNLSERSDVYSLGCVVYEMLSGSAPFAGATMSAVIARHATDPVPSLRTVRSTVPPAVERVLGTALAKVPNDRYASTTELARALRESLQPAITGPGAPAARPRRLTRLVVGAVVVMLVAVASILLARRLGKTGTPSANTPPMLAVLMFENLGGPDDAYFADGMTDEITTRLAHISGLGVIARNSAIQFNPRTTAIGQIARQLGAQWILTGTIRTDRREDGTGTVRVTPRLFRASEERVAVWEESFDAAVSPGAIIQAQAKIAQNVAAELDVALLQQERVALEERPTENAQAYDAFLRGTTFASRPFAEEPTRKAIEMFERAVQLDPSFLNAYAKLAEVGSQYYFFFDRSPARLERVRSAVDRALAIDSTHVAARVARGYYLYWALADVPRAIAEFESVRQAESNNSQLLYVMGSAYRRAGRWEDALKSYERALALNPRAQQFAADLGSTHLVLRNFEDAERYLNQAVALAPDWMPPYAVRGHLYLSWRGDIPRVREVLQEAAAKGGYPALMSTMINRFRYLLSAAGGPLEDSLANIKLGSMRLDSASYYLVKAQWHGSRGRESLSRSYYDSARAVAEPRVGARPNDADAHIDLGLSYAGLRRRADAEREAQRAVALLPTTRDAYFGPLIGGYAAQIYAAVGNADSALSIMREKLLIPSSYSPAMLRVDPHFAALRGDARFKALVP